MNSRAFTFTAMLIFATAGAATIGAQQDQAAHPFQPAQSQSAAQTAQPAAAQNNQGGASSAATPATPAKKVWTNEDLRDLRGRSAISTFDPKTTSHANGPANNSARATRGRDAGSYRQQIAKLQNQIPPLDDKIAQLHAAIEGSSTNDPNTSSRPYRGVRAGSWQAEMEQLQTKRANILARISALQDRARHAGVAPNALP